MKKVLFIVNPASAGGRTLNRWNEVLPQLEAANFNFDVQFTTEKGCAIKFVLDAVKTNYDTIVSVGGDGTANEVVNGLMQVKIGSQKLPNFTIFPSGTGSDSVRTLGIPKDVEGFIKILEKNFEHPIDIGIAEYTQQNQQQDTRFFLNACDVGIGATVADTVNSMNQNTEQQTGKAKYFRSIIEQVFKFKAFDASVTVGEKKIDVNKTVIIAICNGMFFGGGIKISPVSKMDDGMLELFATDGVSKTGLLSLVSKVYSGSHVGHSKVKFQRFENFKIELEKPQLLETDGEVCGLINMVEFSVVKGAINILC